MSDELDRHLLDYLEPEERAALELVLAQSKPIWSPLPGPQSEAFHSEADIVGYGGAAGGGKTDLAIGLALTGHRKIGFFRQNGTELTAVIDRLTEILGGRDGYSGQDRIWRVLRASDAAPVQIELGSFPAPGDETKYQGRPHDLLVFDEAANMRESAVRFLMGWLRSTDPTQRKRVLMCFNPPTNVAGRWVVKFFAPWLDKKHPNPAVPGEIRWFITIEKEDREVDGPEPIEHEGKLITPQSRTFIASRVTDNPHLAGTNYEAQLQSLQEPLRSLMLYGDFQAGVEDDPYQVIPTEWVEAAMARWSRRRVKTEMHSMGVDVARGGRDKTVIARRHGMWFDEAIEYPGSECKDGATVAGFITAALRNGAPVHIDLLGVGAEPYGHLMRLGHQSIGVNFGDPTGGSTSEGNVRFFNLRSELWWRMREALEPNANTGIELPPDQELLGDLCTPTWELRSGRLKVQSREEIVAKIGRSPDKGTAYILALIETMKARDARELLYRGNRSAREYDPFDHV